jgi:hypothetical protein
VITAPDDSWCYLGPPKTGSTTLTELLQKPPFCGRYSGAQHDMEPPRHARMVLATIRSPFTRALSLWKHRRVELLPPELDKDYVHRVRQEVSFEEFLSQLIHKELEDFYSWTLTRWLRDVPRPRTVRLEFLREDLMTALPQYDWSAVEIPRLNDTDRVEYDNPLAQRHARDLVRRWAYRDFLRFPYSWEP